MADKVYDLIIIGAGPAGITAAVYGARKQIDLLVISPDIGGQAAWSADIENYTGYQFITGPELSAKFEEHMRKYEIPLKENEAAVELRREGSRIKIKTDKSEYEANTVIIASGKRTRELNITGEKEFKNRGLSYCATCDGPLFTNKDVAVIGGGNSALDATLQLMRIARSVYLINIGTSLGGEEVMRSKVESSPKVKVLNNSRITGVFGSRMVERISLETENGKEELAVQGIFVEIGLIPNSDFALAIAKNSQGEIKVNCRNETNVEGIFAAGDVTDVTEKQIIIAAGEGSKALLSAFRYLSEHTF